jgi:hypothetical protein
MNEPLKPGDKVRFVMYFRYIKPTTIRRLVYNPPLEWVDEIVNEIVKVPTNRSLWRLSTEKFKLKNWWRGIHKGGEEVLFHGGFLEKI